MIFKRILIHLDEKRLTTVLLRAGGLVDSSEILDVNVVLWVTMCRCDIGLSLLFDVIVVLERFVNLPRFKSLSYSNYAYGYPGYISTSEICASAHGSCLCKYFSVCVHFSVLMPFWKDGDDDFSYFYPFCDL